MFRPAFTLYDGRRRPPPDLPLQYQFDFSLSGALAEMPLLRSVTFSCCEGVPLIALSAVLSIPKLRDIRFDDGRIAEWRDASFRSREKPDLAVTALASLTCPRKVDYRVDKDKKQQLARDIVLVDHIARQAHRTLEVVVLPSQVAPYQAFQEHVWPCLRHLALHGRRHTASEQSGLNAVPFLLHMPNLRVLKLELSQPRGMERCMIWPPGMNVTTPCPDLETLCLSYPHPDDHIFSHLPQTLRRLALRCWPRHYMHLLWHDRQVLNRLGLSSPILTSSEMLSIIRRCQLSPLTGVEHLDIEFEEDERCTELLSRISFAFPNVTFLTVHRYRRTGMDMVPVVSGFVCW